MADDDLILETRSGAVATVVLNRPERMNALNESGWRRLREVMQGLSANESLRCVVVRGAGGTFAAGADIAEFERERATVEAATRYGAIEYAGVMAVAECVHPTVALIEGACVGGGLEIASACDLRICGPSSRFGVPINRLGLTMSVPELAFFLRVVGRNAALEILLEGQVFGADRAYDLGLVTRVVADEEVEAEAYRTADRVAAGAPLVNRWHKRFIRRMDDPAPLTPEEEAEGYAAFGTEDFRIGYRAFLARRRPRFEGR